MENPYGNLTNNYDFTKDYWHILSAQLFFVIAFLVSNSQAISMYTLALDNLSYLIIFVGISNNDESTLFRLWYLVSLSYLPTSSLTDQRDWTIK
jgi:hypothetical protein